MKAYFIKFPDRETCDRMRRFLYHECGFYTAGMVTRPWAIVFIEEAA